MYLLCYKTFTLERLHLWVWWQPQNSRVNIIWVGSWNVVRSEMFLFSWTNGSKENRAWKKGWFFWRCCIYCWHIRCSDLPLYNRSFLWRWHCHDLSQFVGFWREQTNCQRVMECGQLVMFEAMNGGVVLRSKGVCMQKLLDSHCGVACLGLSWIEELIKLYSVFNSLL